MLYYIIKDRFDDIYLGNSNDTYVPVTETALAIKFNSKDKAKNVIRSSLPKILKSKYEWSVLEKEIDEEPVKINNEYTSIDIDELKKSINELSDKFATLKGNKEWLLSEESNIDREISDILHYIEFNTFSACAGYKLCKALKELRIKRREVKNELEIINIVNVHTCNTIANGRMNKAIDNIEHKQYAPRVLTELFSSNDVNVLDN